jgi:hypothetical protein
MRGSSIQNTWMLMRYAWHVLRKDKELILFTVFSSLLCMALAGAFGWAHMQGADAGAGEASGWATYAEAFLFLFIWLFIIYFFNAAIVGAAVIRMRGGNPTLRDGFHIALVRLPWIAGWALISATVGTLLRMARENVPRWLLFGLEVSWALVSFLVIPIIVIDGMEPTRALKHSTHLVRETWGEQVTAGVSFGLFSALLVIPFFFLLLFIAAQAQAEFGEISVLVGVGIVYAMLVSAVISTLEAIYKAALYCYVADVETPGEMLPSIAGAAVATR